MEKLQPLPAHPAEAMIGLGSLVAIAFVFFALWKVSRREWTPVHAITLVLLTFLVPFSGPVVAVLRAWWGSRRATAA